MDSAQKRSALASPPRVDAPRTDAWEKVTGSAVYIEDLPEPPGTIYAAPLHSPYAHARVASIDSSRAARLPGVREVLDREHLDEFDVHPEGSTSLDPDFIATDKARFQGDLLGMVAATDLRTARRAVELIEVEYELLPPVFSAAEALAPGAPLVHEHLGTNHAFEDSLAWGDVEGGLREADRVFEFVFTSPTVFHHPMEPVGSALVSFANGIAELWVPTNTPVRNARVVARLLGLRFDQVRLHVPYVGGGFGAKDTTREMLAALAISRKLGRPVKLVATEAESFCVAVRHAMDYRARVGVTANGQLVALDVDLLVDAGAYFPAGRVAPHNAVISAWGCYRIPHYRARAHTAFTNKVPATPHRGTGKTQTTFSIECIVDRVARELGFDPVEFRRRNVLLPGERVAARWTVRGEEGPSEAPPIDVDLVDLMEQTIGALTPDEEALSAPGAQPSPLARGRGVALSLRHTSKGEEDSQAMATMAADGTVTIAHNAADLGQGVFTMISLVASRTLGLLQSHIRVEKPDTGNLLPFPGVTAQRTTVQMGNAVQAACEHLKQQVIDLAGEVVGGSPASWRLAEGRLWREGVSYALPEILGAAGGVTLKATGSDREPLTQDRAFGGFDHWSPGAAAAEVEVDHETGEVRVLQYAIGADAGTILHPSSARGQLEGGAIMGFGIALFEELIYQDGQAQNMDAFQYRLPLMRDVPAELHTIMIERGDGPGPFGAKGIAQTSIPCVAPAIANAIAHAIGAPITSTPITPAAVLRALGTLPPEA